MDTPNYLKQAVEDDTPDTDAEMVKDLGLVNTDPDNYDDYGNVYDDDDEYDEYADYTCVNSDTWERFTSARNYFQNLANDLLQERTQRESAEPISLLRNHWNELSDEPIFKYWYTDIVKIKNGPKTIFKYVGNSNKPIEVKNAFEFKFREIFL